MSTPLSSILGGGAAAQRRETHILTSSNPALPIPLWAQGGGGIVYVTGVGGGAGGSASGLAASLGAGGGAGGYAVTHPVIIPPGVLSVAAVIGAGGAGGSVSSDTTSFGGPGGQTSLTVGANVIRLNGGGNGTSQTSMAGGWAYMNAVPMEQSGSSNVGAAWLGATTTASAGSGAASGASTLGVGAGGSLGNQNSHGFGAGAPSLFGSCLIRTSAPSANSNGVNATGHGAGGQSAAWFAGGAVTAGNGSPGLLILTFVEGA